MYKLHEFIKKYHINAKKFLGQNFLNDQNTINKIVDFADVENKNVIEVGPGLGALTFSLLNKVKKLIAYEIDYDLANVLKKEIDSPNFELHLQDFLKANLIEYEQVTLISNLPYYITSKIIFKVFKNINSFDKAIFMMQKEVAERILAKPGHSSYGKLSVTVNYYAEVQKGFAVHASCFEPKPSIDSEIILLKFNKTIGNDHEIFLEFIKNCFMAKRKTIYNNLKKITSNDKAGIALDELDINRSSRAETLSLEQFKELFYNIFKENNYVI
jgi:16S rRNA (adenine1518-N6/adenine1519-N6)-dimethyltransferase